MSTIYPAAGYVNFAPLAQCALVKLRYAWCCRVDTLEVQYGDAGLHQESLEVY